MFQVPAAMLATRASGQCLHFTCTALPSVVLICTPRRVRHGSVTHSDRKQRAQDTLGPSTARLGPALTIHLLQSHLEPLRVHCWLRGQHERGTGIRPSKQQTGASARQALNSGATGLACFCMLPISAATILHTTLCRCLAWPDLHMITTKRQAPWTRSTQNVLARVQHMRRREIDR